MSIVWKQLQNQYVVAAVSVGAVLTLGLRKYMAGGVCPYAPDLSNGNFVLITGANTGIGRETAHYLATKCKAKVIIACRSVELANEAKQYIGGSDTQVMKLDLADQHSIRGFIEDLKRSGRKVDILINNAGIMACPQMQTKDGWEMQFGTNHLGHFILTNLLLSNNLINERGGRVVTVASRAHQRAPPGGIQFEDLMFKNNYKAQTVYAQSKLANILFARELQTRLDAADKDILSFSLHPGIVRTELGRYIPGISILSKLLFPVAWVLMKSPQEGAQTSLYCALAPAEMVRKSKGGYFSDCAPAQIRTSSGTSLDDAELTKKLWNVSEDIVGLRADEKWWTK